MRYNVPGYLTVYRHFTLEIEADSPEQAIERAQGMSRETSGPDSRKVDRAIVDGDTLDDSGTRPQIIGDPDGVEEIGD